MMQMTTKAPGEVVARLSKCLEIKFLSHLCCSLQKYVAKKSSEYSEFTVWIMGLNKWSIYRQVCNKTSRSTCQ